MTDNLAKIGMIADDLTGAGDSGIQFTKKGLKTTIILDVENMNLNNEPDEMTVINTDSRSLSIEKAYEKVYAAASYLKNSNVKHVYKKIDSTLRGNLGAEIRAVSDMYEPDFTIIAPAYPEMGRTTVNGIQLLNGQPVEETEISQDPKTPVYNSNIVDVIKQQTPDTGIASISFEQWRSNSTQWNKILADWKTRGIKWLVFDAEKTEDLEEITAQLSKTNYSFAWVGSAGLAKYLPETLGMELGKSQDIKYDNHDPVLVVSGSTSDMTKKQICKLIESGTKGIEIDPFLIFDSNKKKTSNEIAENTCKSLRNGEDVVLYSGSSHKQKEQVFKIGKEKGYSPSEISNKITGQIGLIIQDIMAMHTVRNFVLTGGDTAKDVCYNLGFTGMRLIKEIEPGIPLGQIIEEPSIKIVTKAGAFGTEFSLENVVYYVKKKVVSNEQ